MSETPRLYDTIAPLRNVAALVELIERVKNRAPGLPGLAVFHGYSGFGKTTAAIYAANKFRAYNAQVKSCWTKKALCEAILEDMGIIPKGTIPQLVDQIALELGTTGRPLLIDEADHLVAKNSIEIIRDIYESSGAPVILIGEENLPGNLLQYERVHGRVLSWVAAEPGTLEDLNHLAPIYAKGLSLSGELRAAILTASHHSIRRICTNLALVLEYALINGITELDVGDCAQVTFMTGQPPKPRRAF